MGIVICISKKVFGDDVFALSTLIGNCSVFVTVDLGIAALLSEWGRTRALGALSSAS